MESSHGGKTIPSLAFVHIPLSVTEQLREQQKQHPNTEPGLNTEIISAQADDYAVMNALAETKGLIVVFSGHDHREDWWVLMSQVAQQQTMLTTTGARSGPLVVAWPTCPRQLQVTRSLSASVAI